MNRQEELESENKRLNELNGKLEWRYNHARSQYFLFLKQVLPLLSTEKKKEIFISAGRNCAKSLGWADLYKNNPEGFFRHMHEHAGECISFSNDKKTITVVTQNRPCDCPLMRGQCGMDGAYCDCSLGWQMETYETILQKRVSVDLKESCLRGSGKCVFEITVLD
jgi:predicted hydrocarbon binding protein